MTKSNLPLHFSLREVVRPIGLWPLAGLFRRSDGHRLIDVAARVLQREVNQC
jgi:hypothetical protein